MRRLFLHPLLIVPALLWAAPVLAADDPRPQFGASLEVSDAEEAEILDFVREHAPDRIEPLERLKRRDPARYAMALQRVKRQVERAKNDPEARARMERIQGLRHEIKALAIEHRAASDKEQKRIRNDMERLANQIFDLRQDERRQRIDEIKARLEEAEAEIADQEANRDAVIAEHLDKVLQER
jgi:hypothetical protein